MQRRPRIVWSGVIVVSIALVATACQSDGDDDAGGTPIEEPSTVTEATSEPTTPSTESGSDDDTAATTPADDPVTTPADDPATTLVLATAPPVKTSPIETAPPGAPSDETVYDIGMIDRGLAPFVRIATDDLAERLDVAPESIEVLTAVLVTWPDASVGCPEPDRAYATVLTDGSVIELGVDGLVYRYHSGGNRAPFPCDLTLDPVPEPFAAT